MFNQKIIQLCCSGNIQSFLTQCGKVYKFEIRVHGFHGKDSSIDCELIDPQYFNHEKVVQLGCSNYTLIALTKAGSIYKWGLDENTFGFENPKKMNESLFGFEKIQSFDMSIHYFVFVKTQSGKLYAWGCNRYGQLAIGDHQFFHETPVPIDPRTYNNENPIKVCCGLYHTLLMTHLGNVYTCGLNQHADLGLGHNNEVNTFQQVKISSECCVPNCVPMSIRISDISASMFSIAIDSFGKIYTWGEKWFNHHYTNQLTDMNTPHQIDDCFLKDEIIEKIGTNDCISHVVTNRGNFYHWNSNMILHVVNPDSKKVQKKRFRNNERIACVYFADRNSDLYYHFLALTESGKIIAWEHENEKIVKDDPTNVFVDFCFSYPCSFENEKIYINSSFQDVQMEFQ